MKKQRPRPPVGSPMLVTDAAPAQSHAPAAHPAPTAHADDPEIRQDVWRLLRRSSHLIAVDEHNLRSMQALAPDDAQVARELMRVGQGIDALRAQIVTLADLPGTHA